MAAQAPSPLWSGERPEQTWTPSVGQHLPAWLVSQAELGFFDHRTLFDEQGLLNRDGMHLRKRGQEYVWKQTLLTW